MMDGIRRRFKKFLCVTQRVSGEEVSVVKAASEVRTTPNITATNDHECFAFPGLETLAAASEEDIRTFCMLTTKAQQPTAITNYNAIYADMVKYRSQSFVL
eukprot:GHVT01085834.1.p1 GENE.GHVT01085834.1~~GHVT01085834.1.p1  ORF type:complete len:101 (-),score=7.85 GHVT01085834.1:802-1104(-)